MAFVHQQHHGFMGQQLSKLLSRLARNQHRKLGHVFNRVARTHSGHTRSPGVADLEYLGSKIFRVRVKMKLCGQSQVPDSSADVSLI